MRIACISDTHGRPFDIPECDVFIHAGDMTTGGTVDQQMDLLVWLGYQDQARYKIVVPGNHDKCYEEYGEKLQSTLLKRFQPILLIDSGVNIEGVTFWGSPWTPPFFNWSFMKPEEELAETYRSMPNALDILITHGPPYGILDPGWKQSHAGSLELRKAVASRKVNNHVFGHLHGAGGKTYYDPKYTETETRYFNVAACNEAYQIVNPCKVIDI